MNQYLVSMVGIWLRSLYVHCRITLTIFIDGFVIFSIFLLTIGEALGETGDVFKQLAEIKDNLVRVQLMLSFIAEPEFACT